MPLRTEKSHTTVLIHFNLLYVFFYGILGLRRNVRNIEDALSQIQGTLNSYAQQSCFLSSNSNISRWKSQINNRIILTCPTCWKEIFLFSHKRSCTPSPKPPSRNSHHQALSAVEAYTKLLQEQSMTCFKSSQQTKETQEKQQDHSPQVCCLWHLNLPETKCLSQ